ncbi:MAG: DUF2975 domain-containing protein [Aeromicrobium sp.]|nr:MAG: DUF2975 domain-containing protein [Aeromicrobium sp.]
MQKAVILATRGTIVFFVLLSLLGQIVVIPFLASEIAQAYPEFAHLKVVGIVGCIAIVLCVQVALVCMWRLLTLVSKETIFDPKAFAAVNILAGSFFAVALLALASQFVLAFGGAGHPSLLLLATVSFFGGLGLGLLMLVMKELLRKATTFAHDLEEVI